MWRGLLATGLWAILAAGPLAQDKPLEPAKPAPPLSVKHWIQPREKPASNWQDLRGKMVVVEFWATWCGPCVEAIPHLNELSRKFRDRGVQFLSVTDEDAATVEKFLKKRPIDGWVALDTDHSMFDAYGVQGVPRTAFVDANGSLLSLSGVDQLTEAVLEEMLTGNVDSARRKLAARPSIEAGIRGTEDAQPATLEILIRPSKPGSSATQASPNRFAARGMDLKSALSSAYGISPTRIVMPEWQAGTTYDILVNVPKEKAARFSTVFQQALETAFGFHVRRETRELEVFVLVAPQAKTAAFHEPAGLAGISRSGKGSISMINMPVASLAYMLDRTSTLGRPVLDETGIAGKYDYAVHWDPQRPESVLSAVREQLGLELREARRPVEHLIVEPKSAPSKP